LGSQGAATYAAMAGILAIIGWGQLARQVRGRVLQLRSAEYVLAAQALGASPWRIIVRHLVPNLVSIIVVVASVSIPEYLLVESSLSFLGIGLTPPLVSWGVLLKDAQTVRVVVQYPWLLLPGVFIVITMLAFNFVGDGVRDAFETRRV
jgi:peptide/nickel transport system permease protein